MLYEPALQCLLHLPHLSSENETLALDITKRSHKADFDLMKEWLRLYKNMWEENDERILQTRPIFIEFLKRCQKKKYFLNLLLKMMLKNFLR